MHTNTTDPANVVQSVEKAYLSAARFFFQASKGSVLLEEKLATISRRCAERSRKIASHFDGKAFKKVAHHEALSDDLEKVFYTVSYLDTTAPVLAEIHEAIEQIDALPVLE